DIVRGGPRLSIHAVDGGSLQMAPGETLGLIGESGSGKTTLGWLIARLHDTTSGRILFEGKDITRLGGRPLRALRRQIQVVFQDPVGSLDPRMRVWQIVGEPMRAQIPGITKAELKDRVAALLPMVGLPEGSLEQYPHEFSGGGRQRLSLARALGLHPKLIILDEPTSALDVAVQAQILNRLVTGEIPTLIQPPPGCRFASRCPFVIDRCRVEEPLLRSIPGDPERTVACHRAEEIGDVAPRELLEPQAPPVP